MANFLNTFRGWFGRGGAVSEYSGEQSPIPNAALVSDSADLGVDGALQISTVWACIELRANTIASLPFFAYTQNNGQKELARDSRLYSLLHESPNSRMTPFEFWRAMMLNHDLRGNAYARIDRDANGEAVALWPMPADQVTVSVLDDGSMIYVYRVDQDVAVFAESSVLHLKNLGNGTVGLAKLEFMRATMDEASKAQASASKIFGNGGKPTGVLMVDGMLKPEQRAKIRENFSEMQSGSVSRLFVLEAHMKYQQLSISPEDQQLLESRRYGVEECCRWFGVPAVLVNHAGVVQYGNHDIVEGFFYKLTIRPVIVGIEQAVRKRVMTTRQRVTMSGEMEMSALLRGSAAERAEMYAKGAQNGWITRAEIRQLEGWPYIAGSDELTAQSNLVPLSKLGATAASGGNGSTIAQ